MELARNFNGNLAACHQAQNLDFTITQLCRLRPQFGARDASNPGIDNEDEPLEIDGFGDVVVDSEPTPFEFIVSIGERGHKHEGYPSKAGREFGQALEHFKPRHRRHADVAQDEVWRGLHDGQQALFTAIRGAHLETAIDQLLGNQRGCLAVIFDAQNFLARLCHAAPIPEQMASRHAFQVAIIGKE
ncbi:MAG: hypothetical protein WB384_18405 [Candidatus Sulfotelmatobacter sp.]